MSTIPLSVKHALPRLVELTAALARRCTMGSGMACKACPSKIQASGAAKLRLNHFVDSWGNVRIKTVAAGIGGVDGVGAYRESGYGDGAPAVHKV